VESQTNSLVERIEPKIAALVVQGRRGWDPIEIDFDVLAGVPQVQDRLAGLDAEGRADPDAKLKAIGDALEAAIKTLPNPYREAALEQFGFTDQRAGEPYSKGIREDRAAKKFGRGARWYRDPHKKYFGMKTSSYVIALVTCAFCGVANPINYINTREGAGVEAPSTGPTADHGSAARDSLDASPAKPLIVGGLASLGATMVSREPDHLEVFWIGPNNEVFYRWWQAGRGWSPVESWAEPATVALTAISRWPEDEVLFGLSPDGRLWCRIWRADHRGWRTAGEVQWFEDDEVICGPLASTSRGEGVITLLAFDARGRPWHRQVENDMRVSPWTYDE
jgi:hypothetical protein